jgi:hypothetical protein
MQAWSLGSPVPVGQAVTFSASGTDDVLVAGFEWDFDGDEEPDAYSDADSPGKSATGSVRHAFSEPASVFPAVRAVDDEGFVSPWAVLEEGGSPVQLVIGPNDAPSVVMGRWSPYSALGYDGPANTVFEFSASASSGAGIDRLEWDFDGDGAADKSTAASGTSVSAAESHAYGTAGSWVPRVRAVDLAGVPSVWAAYTQSGNPVALDTFVPELDARLTFELVAAPEGGGAPATFDFAVDADAEIFYWDFDGDGAVDDTTSAPAASHTYARNGVFLPNVTVEDAYGTRVLVSPADGQGRPLYISVLGPDDDYALYDPAQTYCGGMTIEQLIAGGSYNVMDFRSEGRVIIRGTSGADLILGGSIKNLILAAGGDDCVITGGGNGQAFGNAGDDTIFGGVGGERLVGGPGNDACSPAGDNILIGCETKLES